MEINDILKEAIEIAKTYDLQLVEKDRTGNIISLNLFIDNELFIQIYGNSHRDKVNLALIFKNQRLYGFDSEGGKYHFHPTDAPDSHIFINEKKSIGDFVQESMRFLEKREIL